MYFVGEYQQHLCSPGDLSCTKCSERLPRCVGLTDGRHAVPSHLWLTDYIVCYKNRTVNVTQCARDEYFNPRLNTCMKNIIPGQYLFHMNKLGFIMYRGDWDLLCTEVRLIDFTCHFLKQF